MNINCPTFAKLVDVAGKLKRHFAKRNKQPDTITQQTGISLDSILVSLGPVASNFALNSNDVTDVSFSKDGKWIASGSSERTVSVCRLSIDVHEPR